jgi:phage protein D
MAVADLTRPLTPNFEVLINGSPLEPEARGHIAGLSVDHSTEVPSMFEIELVDSVGVNQGVTWIDDESLASVGNLIEIKLGYADDLETLIVGEVTGVEPEFVHSRQPTLTVRGYDRRHRLQRGRKTRTFLQQKDSDIASQIASEAGLTAQVEDSGEVHDYVLQLNQTDLSFLRERARRIQYEVAVEDKALIFRPVASAESEIMTLSLADHLLEFYPRLVSGGQASEVSVRSWNPKDREALVGQARVGDEVSLMGGEAGGGELAEGAFGEAVVVLSGHPVMTQGEADQLAKARFNALALGLITGEGICWGRTDLVSGSVIRIDGVGQRFGGQYYVTAALHRYSPQHGYRTHFTVRRSGS